MKIRFQVRPSPTDTYSWECGDAQFEIGRGNDCKLRIQGDAGRLVSTRHAQVELTPAGAFLTDLRSTNGTFLNGGRLTDRTALRIADQIQFGQGGPKLEVLAIELPTETPVVPGVLALPPAVPIPALSPAPVAKGLLTPAPLPAVPGPGGSRQRFLLIATGLAAVVLVALAVIAFRPEVRRRLTSPEAPAAPEPLNARPLKPAPGLEVPKPGQSEPEVVKPKPPEPVVKTIKIEEKPWVSASLVIVNPGPQGTVQQAVAIEQTGEPPVYKVLAKLEGEEAARAAEVAWEARISIIADDQALARKIFGKLNQGQSLDKPELEVLSRKWREYRVFPKDATLVVFNDLQEERTRLGYRGPARAFGGASDELWFRDVRDKEPKPFHAENVQDGTLREGISDEVLLRIVGLDFLDYCLYRIANALSTEQRQAMNIYVVGDMTEIARPENRYDMLKLSPHFSPRPDQLRMRSEADRLTRESERLAAELRARLVDMGLPVVEWSKEFAFGAYDTDFRRPAFKLAMENTLLGVSHVLMFRVRTPHKRGMYELSLRLVDLRNGRPLWQGQADRLDPSEANAFELVNSQYLLHTGQVKLLELNSEVAIVDESTRAWAHGGVPLLVPPIRLKAEEDNELHRRRLAQQKERALPFEHKIHGPAIMRGQQLRLGYLIEKDGASYFYRDLFSKTGRALPAEALASEPLLVEYDRAVPSAHQMRYFVWRLVKFILPVAGQVEKVVIKDGRQQVTSTLCHADGIKGGEKLVAIRMSDGSGAAASETVLPQELTVRSVTDKDSVANVEPVEGVDPKTVPAVQLGDLVHVRRSRKIVVAVLPPRVDMNTAPTATAPAGEAKNLTNFTTRVGKTLCDKLDSAMGKLGVEILERAELDALVKEQQNENFDTNEARLPLIGRVRGATHVVLTEISPGYNNEANVQVRVVDVETSKKNVQFDFKFNQSQYESWGP